MTCTKSHKMTSWLYNQEQERDPMKTKHMDMRMAQRRIGGDIITLVEKYGEFNARGDRIILSRKMIRKLLQDC